MGSPLQVERGGVGVGVGVGVEAVEEAWSGLGSGLDVLSFGVGVVGVVIVVGWEGRLFMVARVSVRARRVGVVVHSHLRLRILGWRTMAEDGGVLSWIMESF